MQAAAGNVPHPLNAWRDGLIALGLVATGLIALAAGDWAAMAGQWRNSSTYNHILFVPLIIGTIWLGVHPASVLDYTGTAVEALTSAYRAAIGG